MKKTILIIMDGWGEGDKSRSNVMANANLPFINSLYKNYPHSRLLACGEDVGLPEGQMGNSEVGHLNLGSGRIIYQDLVRINLACQDNSIADNPVLAEAFSYAKKNNKSVHLLGLVSDGGVHSETRHLVKLCEVAKNFGLEKVFIHVCTDGRDTDPESGLGYVTELENNLSTLTGKIATLIGRYYTMDRDKRWERIKLGYDLMVNGVGEKTTSIQQAIKKSYNEGVTDEFIRPIVVTDASGEPLATVKKDDVFICFNFRTDRLREITTTLTQNSLPEFGMATIPLHYFTMTEYDKSFKDVKVIFPGQDVINTLGEVLSKAGKKQIRIAETEKYPHVTFFFNGGREEPYQNETRIMIHSPKVATYDLKPDMSAFEITDAIIPEIKKGQADFICLNFANSDMVGHTGVYFAIKEAVETVDKCVGEIVRDAMVSGYSIIITSDHGNADYAINSDGSPNTAHSLNPVPCFLIDDDFKSIKDGRLCDIAPTILKIMGIDIPPEMTGKVLI